MIRTPKIKAGEFSSHGLAILAKGRKFAEVEERMHVHVISGDGEAKFWLGFLRKITVFKKTT